MHKSTFAVLAVVAAVFAQQSVISLFLLGFTSQSIIGSVVKSDATATTYSLECGDPANCEGLGAIPETGLTYTSGISTVAYEYVDTDVPVTFNIGCTFSGMNGACSGLGTADIGGSMTTISDVVTSFTDGGAGISAGQDVTLTAGPLPTNSAAPSTTSETSSNDNTTRSASPSGATGATGATGAGPGPSSSSSKAAAPMITQGPWLVGGAVVAAAYAAM